MRRQLPPDLKPMARTSSRNEVSPSRFSDDPIPARAPSSAQPEMPIVEPPRISKSFSTITQPPRKPAAPQTSTASDASPQAKTQTRLDDPVARVALRYVGVDPDAETYWLASIFDETLPDKEREDLMEDLNEEGFADPRHPAAEEIPLIMARLQMIEQVAPFADEFMAEHLAEAYKDLSNMLEGRGPR